MSAVLPARYAQRSAGWYAERAKRLTASDFGAALGLNPYFSRAKLWRIKCGLETIETNDHIQRGIDNEQTALLEYEVESGNWVDEVGLVMHPAHDWLACSPDGLVGDTGLVEVKCPVALRSAPPEYHYAQIQGQLAITGRVWCDYWQWTVGGTYCIRIMRDTAWWAQALPMLAAFWDCVAKLDPPKRAAKFTMEVP